MRIQRPLVLALVAGSLGACAGIQPGERPDGTHLGGVVITAEQIRRTHAHDAFEVLERTRHHVTIDIEGSGRATGLTRRGPSSLLLSDAVAVVIDGVRVSHAISALRDIPAVSIHRIQILTAREAAPAFGAAAGNGAIVVTTTATSGEAP